MDESLPSQLSPAVLDRLRVLQQSDVPVSVDQVLTAANLNHLGQPSSCAMSPTEQCRIPDVTEKQRLYNQIIQPTPTLSSSNSILERLEKENAKLPPQESEAYLLARLERQNALLNADPKSVCIESNQLQADFNTMRKLVVDNKHNATDVKEADWDFWECVVQDFASTATKLPHLLSAKLRHGGIPHSLRGVVWRAIAQSSATHLETLYSQLVKEGDSPYERAIQRDITRTFPHVEMFKDDDGEGQQAMGRLLKAFSVYDAHVGYCQGLAFLVGPLLMTMPEKEAFCVFVRLMETYEMRTMFTLNMEGLHLRLYQFETLLAQLCPDLAAHLAKHSIHTPMYASQWYLTLFAYSFPMALVLRIYDLVFAEGAVETITRVAIAVMQKNEQTLLAMDDFEQLMMFLSSPRLYQDGYQSDPESVIDDTMALSAIITKQRLDEMADTYKREREQEKARAQQVLEIRLQKKSRRESWFGWASTPSTPSTPSATAIPTSPRAEDARDMSKEQMLHRQVESLLASLTALQQQHNQVTEELAASRARERQLAQKVAPVVKQNNTERLLRLEKDQQYRAFVDSLQKSGEFGTLIARALTAESEQTTPAPTTTSDAQDTADSLHQVTSELVSFKLANFEMGQKYEQLCHQHEDVKNELAAALQRITELNEQVAKASMDLDQVCQAQNELQEEHEELKEMCADLEEKLQVARKTASELQVEKLHLTSDVERLEKQVCTLEREKREYFMPRGSFTEEVFAAHETLFGKKEHEEQEGQDKPHVRSSRRHTMHTIQEDYQQKYVESELRCRELEKLLAEAKFKLVEYETTALPRLAQPPKGKRSSSASLSMLASTGRLSTPTSPSFVEPSRVSTDSVLSNTSSKRSSMYSRLWSSFGSNATPTTTTATSPTASVAHKSPVIEPSHPNDAIVDPI